MGLPNIIASVAVCFVTPDKWKLLPDEGNVYLLVSLVNKICDLGEMIRVQTVILPFFCAGRPEFG